jgi:hypothetical protein
MVDATAPEENNHRTPTAPGHQLEDLLRVATVLAAPVEVVVALVTVTAEAEAAAAGAHHTVWQESWWRRQSRGPRPHARLFLSTSQPASPREIQTSGDH